MNLRHAVRDTAVMVIVCVAAMFLHPVAHGPYSAVHGPTTALRPRYRSWVILASIALAAFSLAEQPASSLIFISLSAISFTAFTAVSSPGPHACPLRC